MSKNSEAKNSTAIDCHTGSFSPSYTYYFLACNGIGPICRAYSHGDNYMIAFILFLYLAFLLLELCFNAYQRLPPHEESREKDSLKTVIWLLATAVLFSVLFQLAPYLHWTAYLLCFVVTTAGSACIFYVYFIYDDKNDNSRCCSSNNGKTKSSGAAIDKELEQSTAILDIV